MIFNAQTDVEYADDLRQRALQCSQFAKMYASMAASRREQRTKLVRAPRHRTAERMNHEAYTYEYTRLARTYINATFEHLRLARLAEGRSVLDDRCNNITAPA